MKHLMIALFMVSSAWADCGCHKPKPKLKPACRPTVKYVDRIVEKKVDVVRQEVVFQTRTVVKTKRKMNLIQGMVGLGPNGVKAERSGNTITAEQTTGMLFGAGYSRRLGSDSDLMLGVQGISNRSGLIVLGFEF